LPSPGAAMTLYVCCISTVFEPIELFDSEGHRVMSKSDHIVQNAHSKTVQQCSCSAWVVRFPNAIPPALSNLEPDQPGTARHSPPGPAISIP
jgi:hypothetical protein